MQRLVTTVQIRNNPTSVPPLELTLVKITKIYRGIAIVGMYLVATGGAGGYTFSTSTLPAGFNPVEDVIDPATGDYRGEFSGIPTIIAHNVISATVTDSSTNSTTLDFTLDVVNRLVNPGPNPYTGEIGVPYNFSFNVFDESGGSGTISYAITDGSLPTDLSINGKRIAGTPSAVPGILFPTTVTATDSASGETLDITFRLDIVNQLTLNLVSGLNVPVGSQITQAAVAVGLTTGIAPFVFQIDSSTLPSGVTASIQGSGRFGIVTVISSNVVNDSFDVICIDALGAVSTANVPIQSYLVNQQLIMKDGFGDIAGPNPSTIKLKSTDGSVLIDTGSSSGSDIVYDLSTLGDSSGIPGGGVASVVAGTGISVDDTDPANPIVSASGGGGVPYGVASGINTYTVTLGLSSYTTGQLVIVRFTNANTGASTLDADGLGAADIQLDGNPISLGDILPLSTLGLAYDGTAWQIIGEAPIGGSANISTGLDKDRPAASPNAVYTATDSNMVYTSDGTNWYVSGGSQERCGVNCNDTDALQAQRTVSQGAKSPDMVAPYTILLGFTLDSLPGTSVNVIVLNEASGSGDGFYIVIGHVSNKISIFMAGLNGGAYNDFSGMTALGTGFHQIAISWDNTTLKLVADGGSAVTLTPSGSYTIPGGSARLAYGHYLGSGFGFTTGSIAYLQGYTSALSTADMQALTATTNYFPGQITTSPSWAWSAKQQQVLGMQRAWGTGIASQGQDAIQGVASPTMTHY